MSYLIKKIILGILVLNLCGGCSASSSNQRFGSKRTKDEQTESSSRFNTAPPKNQNEKRDIVKTIPDTTEEEFDELPPKENAFDKKKFIADYRNYINPDIPLSFREKILLEVIRYLETPYKYGGITEDGIDCSGFTKQVYTSAFKYELPRSAREQYNVGERIELEDLEFGDLVFFNTRRSSNPGHVGIYIGEDQFIHASRTLGVTISTLNETYYKKRFTGGRRIENIEE